MGEEQKTIETKPVKTTFSAFSLRDDVRKGILEEFRETVKALEALLIKEAEKNRAINEMEPEVIIFKSKVISLYSHLRNKLTYPEKPEKFRKLYSLDEYTLGYTSVSKLSIKDAKTLLALMGTFIEVDGITKFEFAQLDPTDLPGEMIEE